MKRTSIVKLIASLTPGEVTDFRKFVPAASEHPGYLKLFNLIVESGKWNDGLIRRKLGCSASQLANQKNYLEKRLIQFLTNPKREGPLELFKIAQLLLTRGLDADSKTVLLRGKKIAYEREQFGLLLEMIELEKRLYPKLKRQPLEEEQDIINLLKNLNDLRNLRLQLQAGFSDKSMAAPKISPIEQVRQSPLLKSRKNALCHLAEYEFLKIKAWLCALDGDYPSTEKHTLEVIDLLEKQKLVFPKREEYLIEELARLANIHAGYGSILKANALIDKIHQIPDRSRKIQALKFEHGVFLQFALSIEMGETIKTGRLFDSVLTGLKRV